MVIEGAWEAFREGAYFLDILIINLPREFELLDNSENKNHF